MSKRLAAALLAVFVASAPAAFAEGMGGIIRASMNTIMRCVRGLAAE